MKAALLVIDMQRALCTGAEAAFDIDRLLPTIDALATRARAGGVPVIFVQHEEERGPLEFGNEGWQLAAGLTVLPDDLRLRKTAADSFHQTALHAMLEERGVTALVICGLQSECCVDSTVRRALALGYDVTLAADAHSTMDNGVLSAAQISAHHNVTLRNLPSFGPRMALAPAAEIGFAAGEI